MTKEEARQIWDANKSHTTDEMIDGMPDGNVLVGMTREDWEALNTYFFEGTKLGVQTEGVMEDPYMVRMGEYMAYRTDVKGVKLSAPFDFKLNSKQMSYLLTSFVGMLMENGERV